MLLRVHRYGQANVGAVTDRTLGTINIGGNIFYFIDEDGDARMSLMEASKQGMTKEMFKLIDADGNGFISKKEFVTFVQRQAAIARRKDKEEQVRCT